MVTSLETVSSVLDRPRRMAQKGKITMQSSTEVASRPVPAAATDSQSRNVDDLTYHIVTIAAALLLLGSLWAF
jgi:hypothetical protein